MTPLFRQSAPPVGLRPTGGFCMQKGCQFPFIELFRKNAWLPLWGSWRRRKAVTERVLPVICTLFRQKSEIFDSSLYTREPSVQTKLPGKRELAKPYRFRPSRHDSAAPATAKAAAALTSGGQTVEKVVSFRASAHTGVGISGFFKHFHSKNRHFLSV